MNLYKNKQECVFECFKIMNCVELYVYFRNNYDLGICFVCTIHILLILMHSIVYRRNEGIRYISKRRKAKGKFRVELVSIVIFSSFALTTL